MKGPSAILTAELTKGGVPDKHGIKRGMPGYTYISLSAQMADGSGIMIGELYAASVKYSYVDLLKMNQIAILNEDGFYRGCVWAHHVIEVN
jgi:hypothetical protein